MLDYNKVDMRDALFEEIYQIALKDKDVIFINADTPAFALKEYALNLPKQYINVGVSEQSMILAASGLALSGKKVFLYSWIPFIALRCYEFIKVNICSMNLPITIIGGGAGLSFCFDGPTHHAVCDIALMRTLPEMTIYNPSDSRVAAACVRKSYEQMSPTYIRLDKGAYPISNFNISHDYSIIREGCDLCIISTGIMTHTAVIVANELKKLNLDVKIIDLYKIKPIKSNLLIEELTNFDVVFTLEENSIIGGIGSLISELITDNQESLSHVLLKRIALPDVQTFIYGSRNWLHKQYKLDSENITQTVLNWYIGRYSDD